MKRRLVLIAHNLRSAHNVGSLLRTSEGLGVERVYLSGYTPYPLQEKDERLPHLARKIDHQIRKTALGAEKLIRVEHRPELASLIDSLKAEGFNVAALEQHPNSLPLENFKPPARLALLVGSEVEGLGETELSRCQQVIEIPMKGKKESFNVVVAAAIALYRCSIFS